MNKVAATILEAAGRDEEGKTHVAYGTIVKEIKEVSRSYKEARMAMDVGKIFSAENDIYAYSSLGIGRLIYQLPIPLCKMFIKEIFGNKSPDDFDEETLTTINKFFENSLNVSETSRQLYIHRNTLSIGWISCRRARDSILEFLKMRSHSRLRLWLCST